MRSGKFSDKVHQGDNFVELRLRDRKFPWWVLLLLLPLILLIPIGRPVAIKVEEQVSGNAFPGRHCSFSYTQISTFGSRAQGYLVDTTDADGMARFDSISVSLWYYLWGENLDSAFASCKDDCMAGGLAEKFSFYPYNPYRVLAVDYLRDTFNVRIVDAETGEPLAGARARIERGDIGGSVDAVSSSLPGSVAEPSVLHDSPSPPSSSSTSQTIYANGVPIEMIAVQGGTFQMGATSEQGSDADDDEKPVHSVTLSSYQIGKYEVTQKLWKAVMGSNPEDMGNMDSKFFGDNLPVVRVSWDEIQTFITKLNQITGKRFRLPTEAEWEYAARGGNSSRGYKYSGSDDIDAVAWYDGNSGSKTHAVGGKSPNELGIYDMSGNVWEWCQDAWDYDYYSKSPSSNPECKGDSGSFRVYRGGSWYCNARVCRVSFRNYFSPDFRNFGIGFRLAL